MPQMVTQGRGADGAFECLALICRLHHLDVDLFSIKHRFDLDQRHRRTGLLRAARNCGLRARGLNAGWERLQRAPKPLIARHRNGRFVVVLRIIGATQLLIHDPRQAKPLLLEREAFEQGWSGYLCLFRPCSRAGADRFGPRWFLSALLKYRRIFGEVLVASLVVQLLALITPLFFQVVIDKVLVHQGLSTLDVLAVGLLAVVIFEAAFGALRDYLLAHTSNRVDVELGARLYRHLLSLPLAYFRARRTGDSVARVRELETIRGLVTGSLLTVLIDLPFTLLFLAVLYVYSPTLTWVVAATIPCYLVLSLAVTPALRSRLEEKFARGADNQGFLVESVNGVDTLKSLAVEPLMQRRWEQQLTDYVRASFRATHLGNLAAKSAQLVSRIATVGILWFGARLVMDGELSVGQLVAFNMLAARVSGPVLRLVQLWQDLQQTSISLRRLADILDTPGEGEGLAGIVPSASADGLLCFEQVDFRYRPDLPLALRGVGFSARPGELVGIVGSSGSGKSTLARLLQRLYLPERGRVLLDGIDIRQLDHAWLRRQVAVVQQDNLLFNLSIRDNIALANPGAAMDAVVSAARLAGAHEFIMRLPYGYQTEIGEGGATLSGGQRQRIAIARALIGDSRVLILDEATSALDYQSERLVRDNMAEICRGRTVLVIAHRLSAVESADRILVLEDGGIVEQGTPGELLALGGRYAQLHALQSGSRDDGGDLLASRQRA